MLPIIAAIISRVIYKDNVDSHTNTATALSVPTATVSLMALIESQDPVIQFLGAIGVAISALLVMYKDSRDR